MLPPELYDIDAEAERLAAEHAESLARYEGDGSPDSYDLGTVAAPGEHLVPGGVFVLDGGHDLQCRWGRNGEVIWARGESLMIVAPPGVGKTTIAIQVTAALVGIGDAVLGLPVEPAGRVLYLAMDRPRQIARAMRRRFGEQHRGVLDERLIVHRGPLPLDLGRAPAQLVDLARQHDADVIVVDSLKDACAKLTDDEHGSMVNRAIQMCNAADIDVLVLHHQRKGQQGNKPTKLEDVYGSTWITAGAGSVILLWGEAGSEIVELSHLKQPADPVGPWTIEHDHHAGTSVIVRKFDPLAYVRNHPGCTVTEAAQAEHGSAVKAGSKEWKRTERQLRRLSTDGLVRTDGRERTESGSFVASRYWASDALFTMDTTHGHTEVTEGFPAPMDAP